VRGSKKTIRPKHELTGGGWWFRTIESDPSGKLPRRFGAPLRRGAVTAPPR